jgi:predicted Rossmann fold flavoprotein
MDDVIVVGAGPAGLVAALAAGEAGARVRVLERMPSPGRKLLLTGGTRCNLTHDLDARGFVEACGRDARFLHNALAQFDPAATRGLFERLGVRIRREADGRCFPASGRAMDVLEALLGRLHALHVPVRTGARVVGIRLEEASGRAPGTFWPLHVVTESAGEFPCKRVVLATGGMSYPETGSSGDGHALARSLGHRVAPARPAEVGLTVQSAAVRALAGLSLEDAIVTAGKDSVRGAVLFTHFGLSGPAVLDISRLVARRGGNAQFDLHLDLFPDRSADALDTDLTAAFGAHGGRAASRIVGAWIPERLARLAVDVSGIEDGQAARVAATSRRRLAETLKSLPIRVTGNRGFAEAVVTVGGVDLRDVDPKTMASRIVPGVHFAGELMDLDGPRGGFNLQIAWSTGWAAGRAAARPPRGD